MSREHESRVSAWWTSGRSGIAKCDSALSAIHFSEAEERGGLQGRWTPEQLLLCALAGCFTTTFRAEALQANFEYTDLQVEAEWKWGDGKRGYRGSEIVLHPRLTVPSESRVHEGLVLLRRAQSLCSISRAISIAQVTEPQVDVGKVPAGGWAAETSARLSASAG
ncbi:MAG: OsmC family protein [Candidatus Sulfotelmatobacter sp.]